MANGQVEWTIRFFVGSGWRDLVALRWRHNAAVAVQQEQDGTIKKKAVLNSPILFL